MWMAVWLSGWLDRYPKFYRDKIMQLQKSTETETLEAEFQTQPHLELFL